MILIDVKKSKVIHRSNLLIQEGGILYLKYHLVYNML